GPVGPYSFDYETVAYDAATGKGLWARRYGASEDDEATAIAASPDGARVFVGGVSRGSGYATVAYDAATGAQLWVSRFREGDPSYARHGLAVSPDSAKVYVTGAIDRYGSRDYALLAYDAATGARLWG